MAAVSSLLPAAHVILPMLTILWVAGSIPWQVLASPFDEHEDKAVYQYDRRASALRMCISCSS